MAHSRRISTINERLENHREEPAFIRRLTRIIDDCVRLTTSDNVPNETLDYCITRLEGLQRNVERARGTVIDEAKYQNLRQLLIGLLEEFRRGNQEHSLNTGYRAERVTPTRGAPCYDVTREQLAFFTHCGFSLQRSSELLGVSLSTVKRRIRLFGLKQQSEYSLMTDQELDHLVQQTIQGNKRIGPNAVRARLFSLHHKVQRWRVRESMQRVDPGGAAMRAAPSLQRRTYTVAGPNSLWHIDGNHKLVRWKMVIHGGIDGYSRLLVFLHASNNNRKETVLEHFLTATTRCGIPSRIRVDHGGENNDICELMDLLRGTERGSAIRGRSVHNQRIERNWLDLWNGATNLFYDLFHFMEQNGHLNIHNDIHLWALHYVFLPRLNRELQNFLRQWNNHGLRTEHHQTPIQLFVGRSLELANARLTAMEDMFQSHEDELEADIDPHIVFNDPEWNVGTIAIPAVPCPLDNEALVRLESLFDPLSNHDQLGINMYLNVIDFIAENSG